MGAVYLVRNRRMDRLEGLKIVKTALLELPGALERFEREMRAAARLNHPNIVTAYSSPSLDGLVGFAMEYVDGIDLHQLVEMRGPLPVANACYYVYQVAQGLQHAFEQQLVHRDIKPKNLMLKRDGKKQVIKILDFGLAKATSENFFEGVLTGEGQVLGTPHYMAPEQIDDASHADIRADIYSLGCTLFYLIAGSNPFADQTSIYNILRAHHSMAAPLLDELRSDVPAELAAIVDQMMSKDPARRFQRPIEVAQALAPYFRGGVKPIPLGGARFSSALLRDTTDCKSAEGTRVPSVAPVVGAIGPAAALENAGDASAAKDDSSAPARVLAALGSLIELGPALTSSRSGGLRQRILHSRSKFSRTAISLGGIAVLAILGGLWATGTFSETERRKSDLASPVSRKLAADGLPVEDHGDNIDSRTLLGSATEESLVVAEGETATENRASARVEPPLDSKPAPGGADGSDTPAKNSPPIVDSSRPTGGLPDLTGGDPTSTIVNPAIGGSPARGARVAEEYDNDLQKAEKSLISRFDKALAALRRSNPNPEERLQLIEAVKAEKTAFETRGRLPWSTPMRSAAIAYLRELTSARATFQKAIDRMIAERIKARDDAGAGSLRSEFARAASPRVLGEWKCEGSNAAFTLTLYSDGTFVAPGWLHNTSAMSRVWMLGTDGLMLTFLDANLFGKKDVVNRCTVAADGSSFSAVQNTDWRFQGALVGPAK